MISFQNKKKLISYTFAMISFLFGGIGLYFIDNPNIFNWKYQEHIEYIKNFYKEIDNRSSLGYMNSYNMLSNDMKTKLKIRSHIKSYIDFAIGYSHTLRHEISRIKYRAKVGNELIFIVEFKVIERYPALDFTSKRENSDIYYELLNILTEYYEVNNSKTILAYLKSNITIDMLAFESIIPDIVFINKLRMKDFNDIYKFSIEKQKTYITSIGLRLKKDITTNEEEIVGINSFSFIESL